MIVPTDAIAKVAKSVQPLVFETGIEAFPYSVAGTAFLVGYESRPYVITTRHSLNPESIGPICIFPSDISQHIIPLMDVFFVPRDEVSEDFVDLAIISIDISSINQPEVAEATLIDLARASGDWKGDLRNTNFFILGYPSDYSFVDYDEQVLRTDRVLLHAKYIGPSISPHLHELDVSDPHTLTTFSGFSGSPIFALPPHSGVPSALILCGMAIRGSSESGRIHFLDRSVLLDALKVKRMQETK